MTTFVSAVPLKDNILFAFEKCKSLSVDLQKGQLKEAVEASFDLHCVKKGQGTEFNCSAFDAGSVKKTSENVFTGESELGKAELRSSKGARIKFLIGRTFASYEDTDLNKVCAGIYLFEADARKKKSE